MHANKQLVNSENWSQDYNATQNFHKILPKKKKKKKKVRSWRDCNIVKVSEDYIVNLTNIYYTDDLQVWITWGLGELWSV